MADSDDDEMAPPGTPDVSPATRARAHYQVEDTARHLVVSYWAVRAHADVACAPGVPLCTDPARPHDHSGYYLPWGTATWGHRACHPGFPGWYLFHHNGMQLWGQAQYFVGQHGHPILWDLDKCRANGMPDDQWPLDMACFRGSPQPVAYDPAAWAADAPWHQLPAQGPHDVPGRWICTSDDCPFQLCPFCASFLAGRQHSHAPRCLTCEAVDVCMTWSTEPRMHDDALRWVCHYAGDPLPYACGCNSRNVHAALRDRNHTLPGYPPAACAQLLAITPLRPTATSAAAPPAAAPDRDRARSWHPRPRHRYLSTPIGEHPRQAAAPTRPPPRRTVPLLSLIHI